MARKTFDQFAALVDAAVATAATAEAALKAEQVVVAGIVDDVKTQLEEERCDVDNHAENCKSLSYAQVVLRRFPDVKHSNI